jgi:hypothetical protein
MESMIDIPFALLLVVLIMKKILAPFAIHFSIDVFIQMKMILKMKCVDKENLIWVRSMCTC